MFSLVCTALHSLVQASTVYLLFHCSTSKPGTFGPGRILEPVIDAGVPPECQGIKHRSHLLQLPRCAVSRMPEMEKKQCQDLSQALKYMRVYIWVWESQATTSPAALQNSLHILSNTCESFSVFSENLTLLQQSQ